MRATMPPAVLWGGSVVLIVVAASEWIHAGSRDAAPPPLIFASTPVIRARASTSVASVTAVTEKDPFRLARRPATVPFTAMASQAVAPSVVHPVLILHGTVGTGRTGHWVAVVSGIPNHDGTMLVHEGDTAGGLVVKRIARDSAVILAADTIWHLRTRAIW